MTLKWLRATAVPNRPSVDRSFSKKFETPLMPVASHRDPGVLSNYPHCQQKEEERLRDLHRRSCRDVR